MQITHPQVEEMQRQAYEFCMAYGKNPNRGYRLVISGENGAGKSRVAKKIHKWAYDCSTAIKRAESSSEYSPTRTASAEYWHFPTLLDAMRRNLERNWIDELCRRPDAPNLLVLDDVGAEHDPSKFGAAQLYMILERRSDMWTVLTTNAKPDAWEQKWDRRVSSRLFRNSIHVVVDQVPDFSSL